MRFLLCLGRLIVGLALLAVVVAAPTAQADDLGAPLLTVGDGRFSFDNFPVLRFVDTSLTASADDVAAGRVPGAPALSHYELPVERAVDWLVFRLRNVAAVPVAVVLQFDDAMLENADLMYRQEGRWIIQRNGLAVPMADRVLSVPQPAFPLTLAAGETRDLLVKTFSNRRRINVSLVLEDAVTAAKAEQAKFAGYCLFFGAAAAILLYNVFLAISLRDLLYFYYSSHVANFIFFVSVISGFHIYIFDDPHVSYRLSFSAFLTFAFLALFVRKLFRAARTMPVVDVVLGLVFVVFAGETVLAVIDVHNRYYIAPLAMSATAIFLLTGFYAVYRRLPLATYYLFGMGFYVVGMFMLAAVHDGMLARSFITRHGYLIGSLIELIVFSLALGYRVRLLQEEKFAVQQQLIEAEQTEKQRLERLVAEHTAELRRANSELDKLSRIDALTGLYNRRHFDQVLAREWARLVDAVAPLCLILGDIDYFKPYNDTWGHQAGDECLRAVADTIRAVTVRRGDMAARYGGEEFAVVLPECGPEAGRRIAEALRSRLYDRDLPHPASPLARVTISLGVVALAPQAGISPERLVAMADKALYASKAQGRNRVTVVRDAAAA